MKLVFLPKNSFILVDFFACRVKVVQSSTNGTKEIYGKN